MLSSDFTLGKEGRVGKVKAPMVMIELIFGWVENGLLHVS